MPLWVSVVLVVPAVILVTLTIAFLIDRLNHT